MSLLIINWNYGTYIGATIDSIKSQDYPAIEVIVVDNGSTDDSRDVIGKHAGDDPRFRVVHLDENLGQLGAYFYAFELTSGETIVDADDILFPSFVSSHVQVHLALPSSVALTSSNVVESCLRRGEVLASRPKSDACWRGARAFRCSHPNSAPSSRRSARGPAARCSCSDAPAGACSCMTANVCPSRTTPRAISARSGCS
ncbi:MAG: glycosyltransferase family 2 protein [Methyloceanibacter sp.]